MDEHEVRETMPGWALPHPTVLTQFVPWVLWSDGCDENGVFIGWCPLHDQGRQTEASAEFNFTKGIMRCAGDPCCHEGKRAMSIQNLIQRMANVNR